MDATDHFLDEDKDDHALQSEEKRPKEALVEKDDAPAASTPNPPDRPRDEEVAEGLAVKATHPALNLPDGSEYPTTDLVHVAAICPQGGMRTLGEPFGTPHWIVEAAPRTQTTELVFRVEMAGLLAGDLAEEAAEQQAVKLLQGLVARQSALQPNQGRAIIFVAYDLGSLVVKLLYHWWALTLAAEFPESYPGIVANTSRIIFSGCPQRALNRSTLELKLLQFLQGEKDKVWSEFVTLFAIQHLTSTVLWATERFIASKMTLRSRIVSIYADEKSPGHINALWDRFTATLGVPSEGLVQEQSEGLTQEQINEKPEQRFPLLTYYVAYKVENLLLQPEFLDLEPAFVSLTAPHRQSQFDPSQAPSLEATLNDNENYTTWLGRHEFRPLYVYGSSHRAIHDVSDQISLAWQKRMAEKNEGSSMVLVFNFDSADPLRDSISDMVASFILEAANAYPEECLPGRQSLPILHDWYQSQSGWTDKSSIIMLEALRVSRFDYKTIFVLNNLDQCSQEGRTAFLDYFSDLSDRCEGAFKIVITTRDPQALHGEIGNSLELNADDYATCLHGDGVEGQVNAQFLSRLGGSSPHRSRLAIGSPISRISFT